MNDIIEKLKSADNIAIINHIDPDIDCLGSSFALLGALKLAGKNAVVVLEEALGENHKFLNGQYLIYDGNNCIYDTVVCLDCGSEDRLGKRINLLESDVTINIDHHPTNTNFAHYNYVDSNASATGQLIFRLLEMWSEDLFSREVCENIYLAIASDTGCFKYSNTTAETHIITAKLMSYGVDTAPLNKILFDTSKWSKVLLMSSIVPLIEFYFENKVAMLTVSAQFLKELNVSEQDTGGIAPFLRAIEGVELGIVIKEKPDGMLRVSMRSNEYVDVAEISLLFGGGGHKRAAGFSSRLSADILKRQILDCISRYLKQG